MSNSRQEQQQPENSRQAIGISLGPIRQSYSLIVAGQLGRWIALLVLALLVSGIETLGAGLIYVLITLIGAPEGDVTLPVVGNIRHWLPDVEADQLLIWAGVSIGVFFIIRGASQVILTYTQHRMAYNAGARVGIKLVRGYLAMPYPYHLQRDSSSLVRNSITSIQEVVGSVVIPASKFVAEIFIVIGMSVLLFATSPLATLLALAIIGPSVYLVLRLVRARVRGYGQTAIEASRSMISTLQQSLHGIREIRLLGKEGYFINRFRSARIKDARARAQRATFAQFSYVLVETILMISIVAFLLVTVIMDGASGENLATLGLFAYVGMRLKPSIEKIIATTNNLRFASPAIEDLHRDLTETDLQAGHPANGLKLETLKHEISLESVGFSYDGSDHYALKSVDLRIQKGESFGVCGPTGGGKSTLVDLICGLLPPTEGKVQVDGVDIQRDLKGWYQQLGVVSQSVYLFDDSLRRNIALGVPDNEIDQTRLERAVTDAQLDDFVSSLPKGLETPVGERGTSLSGGQRQRVAIARALYSGAEIIILDEGTSALDNETERKFISSLEELGRDRTVILVAHRLTTIRDCDHVIFVNNGRVEGGGTFEELYEQSPEFRRMAG